MRQDLFNSKKDPIPEIRRDLEIIPVQENGDVYLYFHDARDYATSNLALHREVETLLSLIDGRNSVCDLSKYVSKDITEDQLLNFIQFLDKHGLLNSQRYRSKAKAIEEDYENSTLHKSVTAGSSYPEEKDELLSYLDNAFEQFDGKDTDISQTPRALYAPHIDPRVAMEDYVKAFSLLRDLTPDKVVVFATSHYSGLYPEVYDNRPFILVNKDFELPLGIIPRDEQTISKITDFGKDAGFTLKDRAHRMEHSVELHLLFLRYMWQHDFTVTTILVNGLDDLYYMPGGNLGDQLETFTDMFNKLFRNDKDTFFLISGDLSHIGKKFGDPQPASSMFNEVKQFDRKFLQNAAANNREVLLEQMKRNMDPYRICGFPPLYAFLNSMPSVKGEMVGYNLWDESETESAVSFGSILFRD